MTTRIVVLASGNGSNLQAVLDAIGRGELDARVVGVVSNKPDAEQLKGDIDALLDEIDEVLEEAAESRARAKSFLDADLLDEIDAVMGKVVEPGSRKGFAKFAGGMMFELGCHLIDLVVGILAMGPTATFDSHWEGSVARALKRCAAEVSRRIGRSAGATNSTPAPPGSTRGSLTACGDWRNRSTSSTPMARGAGPRRSPTAPMWRVSPSVRPHDWF